MLKNKLYLLLIGGLFTFFTFNTAAQELITECHSNETPKWSYCIHETSGSQSDKVLYFFHGITGDEKSWIEGANSEFRAGVRKT